MRAAPTTLALALALAACNPHPGYPEEQVGYRDQLSDGPTSGERGTVVISEIMWSGSVRDTGSGFAWDPEDIFVELRNEGALPVNLSGWRLELDGPVRKTFRLPAFEGLIESGQHVYLAKKADGCFIDPDGLMPDLEFPPQGDPIELTLLDFDERLIEPAGSPTAPPFAGGYDLVVSRSMERIQLMFGDRGTSPHMWHHYTDNQTVDVVNNDKIKPECAARTYASPGRPNSPDYSGAFASGGFE